MSKQAMDGMSWALLLIYFSAWAAAPLLFGPYISLAWLLVAGAYALGHYIEMTRKGHCALSADATAFPLALVAALVTGPAVADSGEALLHWGQGFLVAFGAGHLLAFAGVFLYSALFERR